jgi:predicted HicB family RNase H-like nuclease
MAVARNGSEALTRFTDRMFVRCPPSLPAAIDKAASRQLMSASEYIRRSVIDRLKADGVNPAPTEQKA